jgi:hypothetical protein
MDFVNPIDNLKEVLLCIPSQVLILSKSGVHWYLATLLIISCEPHTFT